MIVSGRKVSRRRSAGTDRGRTPDATERRRRDAKARAAPDSSHPEPISFRYADVDSSGPPRPTGPLVGPHGKSGETACPASLGIVGEAHGACQQGRFDLAWTRDAGRASDPRGDSPEPTFAKISSGASMQSIDGRLGDSRSRAWDARIQRSFTTAYVHASRFGVDVAWSVGSQASERDPQIRHDCECGAARPGRGNDFPRMWNTLRSVASLGPRSTTSDSGRSAGSRYVHRSRSCWTSHGPPGVRGRRVGCSRGRNPHRGCRG